MKVTSKKGVPKYNGSGGGNRNNQGRGGCIPTLPVGKGRRKVFGQ